MDTVETGQPITELPAVTVSFHWQHGRLADVETNSPEVEHFLQLFQRRNPYNTWVNYAHDLKVFFRVVPKQPDQVTREDCITFMGLLAETNAALSTINRRLATISSFFDELNLLDANRFPENPVSPLFHKRARKLYKRAPKRVPTILPQAELTALYAALRTWRDRTLMLLQWVSCLRISEAVGIRFADIECSQKRIEIRDSKNHEPRRVYMDENTFKALNRYLDQERPDPVTDQDRLFVRLRGPQRGSPLSVNAVQKLLKYHADQCHLPHVHAHLLRHTGITQLLEANMPESAIRTLVGHKRPESLEPYKHLTDRFVETEFQRSAPVLNTDHWLAE